MSPTFRDEECNCIKLDKNTPIFIAVHFSCINWQLNICKKKTSVSVKQP